MVRTWLGSDIIRLKVAIVASFALNMALFTLLSTGATRVLSLPLHAVEVRRVIIDEKGHKVEQVVKPQEIKKKIERIVKEHPQMRPKVQTRAPAPPPPGAHNKVLTAPTTDKGSGTGDFTALSGGNAAVGAPTAAQQPGAEKVNPPEPPPPPPPPPKVVPTAPVVVQPAPEAPRPKGPTRDATPTQTVQPEIPDELKSGEFKSFVRVKVVVQEDGNFTVVLRTSSGNTDVDRRVLEALKQWKWKPALHEGEAVLSTQLFKFEFEVK